MIEEIERLMEKLEDRRNANIKELVSLLVPIQKDREMLIRMDETQKNIMLLMQNNRNEDLLKISTAAAKADAAHRRVDALAGKAFWSNVITIGGMILTALFVYMKG